MSSVVFLSDESLSLEAAVGRFVFVDRVTGRPDKPFTPAEHQAKLDELAHEAMGRERANEVYALVDRLPAQTPVDELTALLRT